jgi:hypothetical protein
MQTHMLARGGAWEGREGNQPRRHTPCGGWGGPGGRLRERGPRWAGAVAVVGVAASSSSTMYVCVCQCVDLETTRVVQGLSPCFVVSSGFLGRSFRRFNRFVRRFKPFIWRFEPFVRRFGHFIGRFELFHPAFRHFEHFHPAFHSTASPTCWTLCRRLDDGSACVGSLVHGSAMREP